MTPALAPALAGILALVAYLLTLSPSISWANGVSDSGELAAAAYVLGVPHPTTYPLYMILGWAMSHLPLGEPAYNLNLFSAVCGALAAGLVAALAGACDCGRRPLCTACGCVAGGLFFAAVPSFWVQATGTETRALAAALVAAVLLVLARHVQVKGRGVLHTPGRLLVLAWAIEGVALADHLLCLAVLPALVVATMTHPGDRRQAAGGSKPPTLSPAASPLARRLSPVARTLSPVACRLSPAAALLPGLALYAYVPLRAAARPALNWGDASTLPRFLWMVSGAQYRSLMGLAPADIPGRLGDRAGALAGSLGPVALLAGGAGLALLWWRRPRLALVLLLTLAAAFLQSSLYGAAAAPDYLIPCEMVLAAAAGYLLSTILAVCARRMEAAVARKRRLWAGPAALALVVAAGGLAQQVSWQRATAAQQDSSMARGYALSSLHGLPPHALILAQGDEQTFALWYAQFALGIRPDLAVVNSDLLAWQWYATTVRARYPWLRWRGVSWTDADRDLDVNPDRRDERAARREAALIRANVGRVPIFWTTPDGVDDTSCGVEPQGNLFRCYPLS